MKVGDYEVSDTGPLSPYNRGYLEGLAQGNKKSHKLKEVIFELLNHDCKAHRCGFRDVIVEKVRQVLKGD